MNQKGHLINALLLSVGLGVLLVPYTSSNPFVTIAEIMPPIILGALFPDVDTTFGKHRRTFHNLPVLLLAVAFPVIFDNLHYVWIGILTHYILDLLGNVKGMALFHPVGDFYDVPIGVPVNSYWADFVTLFVTALELAILSWIISLGYEAQLSAPNVNELVSILNTFM